MWPFSKPEPETKAKTGPQGGIAWDTVIPVDDARREIGNSYTRQLTEGYAKNPYVARCVDLRAQSVASLIPLVTDADGNEIEGEHPLKAILAHPNPDQSWREFVQDVQTHLAINGNAYILIVTTSGGLRLYAVPPDQMSPSVVTDPFNPVHHWTVYGGAMTADPEKVIHIHGVIGTDGIHGISPLESSGMSVIQQTEAREWNRSLMEKGAKPSLAIIFRNKLTQEGFESFRRRYHAMHTGTSNAGSTLILDEDANIVSAGFNARDMDYANGVTVSAREIAIAFQVPPELIGDSANKTYSNAQEANREFAQHTVVPLADQMYEALSRRLWPSGDAKLTYDRSAIDALKGDESALLTALTACDFLTTNEKRARMNYANVDGGDEILTGMGKVPLSETATPIDQLLGGERC